MTWADQMADRLTQWMRRPAPLSIAAFHLSVDEAERLHTRLGRSRRVSGVMTLFWEDGSVSQHDVTEALAGDGEWPVALWRESRFFAAGRERLLQLSSPRLPAVPVFDPIIAEGVRTGRLPEVPDGLEAETALERRTVVHSRGLYVEEETTACTWTAPAGVPVRYESRRWPTPKHALYLQMEAAWYQAHPVPDGGGGGVTPSSSVLLAPPAFRQLLAAGWTWGAGAHDAADAAECSRHPEPRKPLVTIRHDPLVPWSVGSRRLTRRGTPAQPVLLASSGPRAEPPVYPEAWGEAAGDFDVRALHWDLPRKTPFREWLAHQPEAWLVMNLKAAGGGSPHRPVTAWAPQAVCFRRGRPVCRHALLMTVPLSVLLGSPALEGVEKAGWDGCGISAPAGLLMAHTP